MDNKEVKMASARFRDGLDDDIKRKYNALPDSERSDNVRDALRLWFGIEKKLVFRPTTTPVKPPQNLPKPWSPQKGVGKP
ncbi:hypothetical protein [Paenibacillus sedimenti]|uniref:Uncharacterized protein n=1 Tax=Paenibacillus sedimenti TaxID=2770274 RepID=A0A926QK10_9BACL|nr:hypothetical protein [Paenibacillus sedimenti]MBD0381268.1 hypothetical protein [Paenibacillus sedimenti]